MAMASTITIERSGSGDAEHISLGNGRATVSWGPGTELTLDILRDGEKQTLTVKIGKRPAHLP